MVRDTYYIYIRNVKVWLAQPMMPISAVVMSVFFFFFFGAPLGSVTRLPGFPADDYEAYLTGMIIVMAVVFSGADAAMAILTDILSGYFDKLLLAPISRAAVLLSSLLMAGTRALVQVLVIVGLALALGVSFKGGVIGIVVVVIAATLFGIAWACFGLMIALKTKSAQLTQSSWLLFMPIVFLTSAFMPKEFLSGWFKVAVTINPVDYVLLGVRTIIIEGWVWANILPGLWALLALTVGLLFLATWQYQRATI